MWIIAIGLSEIGHTYAGTFPTLDDAAVWLAKARLNGAHCHILRLNTPQEVVDNLREHSTEK